VVIQESGSFGAGFSTFRLGLHAPTRGQVRVCWLASVEATTVGRRCGMDHRNERPEGQGHEPRLAYIPPDAQPPTSTGGRLS
jgi:hypothetical protein